MKSIILIKKLQALWIIAIAAMTFGCNAQESFGGLALYTVREEMQKNPNATLRSVADAGYQYIEAAGYENGTFYNMTPSDFRALLENHNLTPLSSHHGGISLENAESMMKAAKAAGFKYFVVPVPPSEIFQYDRENNAMSIKGGADNFAEILNILGKKAAKQGLNFIYHNHDFEFKKNEEGIVLIDNLLEKTDPQYVNFEMDLYWVKKAGADPLEYFERYPGRFVLWHVKDMDDEGRFAPVGEGTINFQEILSKKELSGMKFYFVEQDNTYNLKPLKAIKLSHKGLKKHGFN